jgi:hypothetical protein
MHATTHAVTVLADKGSAAYNFGNSPLGATVCVGAVLLVVALIAKAVRGRRR